MRIHWKHAALAAGITAILASAGVRADDNPWEIRLRAVYLDPANKSDAIGALAVPADAIHINSKWIPDLNFEYYFSPHWSAELVLTYPQTQTVTVEQSALGGPTNIGTFKHLPPVLTAKYNFIPDGTFRPYIGAGVNLTLISKVDLAIPTSPATKVDLSSSSVGPAGQAGFDLKLSDHWFANADVKYVMLRSDVKVGGTKISEVKIDPWLFGVGIGYRFGGNGSSTAAAAPAAVATPVAAAVVAAPAPPPPPPPPKVVAPVKVAEEVVLKGVTFETASAKLRKESATTLDGVAASVLKCHCTKVDIRGYTDSVGKPEYNQKLSEKRAVAVKEYLEGHGVAAGILTAQGFGEQNPIASNATAQGRAENRRVTVQYTAPVGN